MNLFILTTLFAYLINFMCFFSSGLSRFSLFIVISIFLVFKLFELCFFELIIQLNRVGVINLLVLAFLCLICSLVFISLGLDLEMQGKCSLKNQNQCLNPDFSKETLVGARFHLDFNLCNIDSGQWKNLENIWPDVQVSLVVLRRVSMVQVSMI